MSKLVEQNWKPGGDS